MVNEGPAVSRWTDLLLRSAASRWPLRLRAEALSEWRAEIAAIPGGWHRQRFAWSLAVSSPHRNPQVSFKRAGLSLVGSLFAVTLVPLGFLLLEARLYSSGSSDTVAAQSISAAVSVVTAVVLGLLCARRTSGVVALIRPTLIPLWTVGAFVAVWLGLWLYMGGLPVRSDIIDTACWAVSAVVLAWAAQLVGPARLAWGVLGVSIVVAFYFANMHSTLMSRLDVQNMDVFFDGRWLPAYLFLVGTKGTLHATIFLQVYAHSLSRRVLVGQS